MRHDPFSALLNKKIPSSVERMLAVGLPFLLACFWFLLDRGYPIYDSADYIRSIYPAAQALKSGDIPAALEAAYWQRGWKVVFLPVLIGPFLAAVDDVRLAAALCNLAIYLVFLVYAARLVRFFLTGAAAVLSAWFVGTLPWVLISVFQFMGELPFMAAGTAALCYLFENDGFASTGHSVRLGAALALAFCLQPFVAAAGIGLVYVYFAVRALRAGRIGDRVLLAAAGLSALAVAAPALISRWDSGRMVLLALSWGALLAAVSASLPRNDASRNFFAAHAVLATSFVLWFAPFLPQLFSWAFECTFGYIVHVHQTPTYGLKKIYLGAGGISLAALAMTAAANVGLSLKAAKPFPPALVRLAAAVFLLFGTVLAALATLNNEPRYHFLGLTLLYVLLLGVGAGTPSPFRAPARALLLLAGLYHAYWIVDMVAGDRKNLMRVPIYRFYYPYTYERLLPKTEESVAPPSARRILHRLREREGAGVASYIDSRINFPPSDALSLMSLRDGREVNFFPPGYVEASFNDSPRPRWRENGAEYVVVGFPRSEKFETYNASRTTAQKLIDSWKEGSLRGMGLEVVDQFLMEGRGEQFLLLKVLESGTENR